MGVLNTGTKYDICGYPSTEEQSVVIDKTIEGVNSIVLFAFAGAGKTSTLIGVAQNNPSKKILYFVFTKPMELEAKEKFRNYPNVEVRTRNSIAYRCIVDSSANFKGKAYNGMELQKIFGISKKDGYLASRIFEDFCNSSNLDFRKNTQKSVALRVAKELFEGMESGLYKQTYSYTMKKLHLELVKGERYFPLLDGIDMVMLDEAQDTNDVTIAIFREIKAKQRIIVGDEHQQIFSFMNSVNAMQKVEGERLFLTQSFRYNQKIANRASKLLVFFKGETQNIVGLGKQKEIRSLAIITRTNAKLIEGAILFVRKGVFYKTTRDPQILFNTVLSIGKLINGETLPYSEKYLEGYREEWRESGSGKSLLEFIIESASKNKEAEHVWGARAIQKYGIETIIDCYNQSVENFRNPAPAQYSLTTGHSAKGLEWDRVFIEEDFPSLMAVVGEYLAKADISINPAKGYLKAFANELAGGFVSGEYQYVIDEINLWYVAMTRAKVSLEFHQNLLDINDLSQAEIEEAIDVAYCETKRKMKEY